MPEDDERVKRDNEAETKEGLITRLIKSSWYTVVLILFLFGGAIVFMGIEGNHEDFENYKRVEEQEKFNKTLTIVSAKIRKSKVEFRLLL